MCRYRMPLKLVKSECWLLLSFREGRVNDYKLLNATQTGEGWALCGYVAIGQCWIPVVLGGMDVLVHKLFFLVCEMWEGMSERYRWLETEVHKIIWEKKYLPTMSALPYQSNHAGRKFPQNFMSSTKGSVKKTRQRSKHARRLPY